MIVRPCVTCASISVAVYVGYVGYVREYRTSADDRASAVSRVALAGRSFLLTCVAFLSFRLPYPAPCDPPNSRESRFRKDRAFKGFRSRARAPRRPRGVREYRRRSERAVSSREIQISVLIFSFLSREWSGMERFLRDTKLTKRRSGLGERKSPPPFATPNLTSKNDRWDHARIRGEARHPLQPRSYARPSFSLPPTTATDESRFQKRTRRTAADSIISWHYLRSLAGYSAKYLSN